MSAPDAERAFGIVVTAKARHGDLWRIAQEAGNAAAVSRLLGIHQTVFGKWLNLQEVPAFARPHKGGNVRYDVAEKITALTGKSLDDLWPEELQLAIQGGEIGKQRVAWRDFALRDLAYNFRERALLPDPSVTVQENEDAQENTEKIRSLLGILTDRERQVIRLRFGFGCDACTLKETGKLFKVTQERVRQIEQRALRKIRDRIRRDESQKRAEEVKRLKQLPPAKQSPLSTQPEVAIA